MIRRLIRMTIGISLALASACGTSVDVRRDVQDVSADQPHAETADVPPLPNDVQVPPLDVPNIDVPNIDILALDVPSIDIPILDVPALDVPALDDGAPTEDVADAESSLDVFDAVVDTGPPPFDAPIAMWDTPVVPPPDGSVVPDGGVPTRACASWTLGPSVPIGTVAAGSQSVLSVAWRPGGVWSVWGEPLDTHVQLAKLQYSGAREPETTNLPTLPGPSWRYAFTVSTAPSGLYTGVLAKPVSGPPQSIFHVLNDRGDVAYSRTNNATTMIATRTGFSFLLDAPVTARANADPTGAITSSVPTSSAITGALAREGGFVLQTSQQFGGPFTVYSTDFYITTFDASGRQRSPQTYVGESGEAWGFGFPTVSEIPNGWLVRLPQLFNYVWAGSAFEFCDVTAACSPQIPVPGNLVDAVGVFDAAVGVSVVQTSQQQQVSIHVAPNHAPFQAQSFPVQFPPNATQIVSMRVGATDVGALAVFTTDLPGSNPGHAFAIPVYCLP